jgi:hypothetical protein
VRSEPEDRKVNGLRHFQPLSLSRGECITRAWGDRAAPQVVVALRLFCDNLSWLRAGALTDRDDVGGARNPAS